MNEKEKLKVLSLFAGIGGIDLGLESTGRFETIQFVEFDAFCQHILRRHWPDVPIWGDVKTFDPDSCGDIDLICGGYPCQPFSVAGKQKGTEDDRHLWPRMFEIIKHKRPTWVLCENVPGHVNLGLDQVLFDLESEGYSWQTFVLGAVAVDAPHRRQRLFIVANTNRNGKKWNQSKNGQRRRVNKSSTDVANTDNTRDRTSQRRTDQNRQTHDEGQEEQPQSKSGGHSTDVANTDSEARGNTKGSGEAERELQPQEQEGSTMGSEVTGCGGLRGETTNVANTSGKGLEGQRIDRENVKVHKTTDNFDGQSSTTRNDQEKGSIERKLGGVVDGVPSWMDEPDIPRVTTNQAGRTQRLKMLGNAVVPQVLYQLGLAMKELWDEV